MCGIAGMFALRDGAEPPSVDALRDMAAAVRHRGPDEFGVYRDARVGLAHARLSIVDLQSGQQPLANHDQRIWVVFNGEIYNHVELRSELETLGYPFTTRSDTEVIVHSWQAWGEACFARFNGQFAIALWDTRTNTFVLARDRVGICPLHLAEHGGRVYFGSEVKSIFAGAPAMPRAFDPIAMAETFTFWSIIPPRSVFAGVSELPPAHVRVYRNDGSWREFAYWQPRYPQGKERLFTGSVTDAADEVTAALREATRLRMVRTDVPVGSYLSGGLDSSLVAALGREAIGASLKTFSLRFEDAEYDETGYQRTMVDQLGSDHHEVVVSRADIARVFPEVVYHTERPLLRTAPAPLFLLSKLVNDAGIKVVLTGEGADEMFAGYDLFREGAVRRFWARAPTSTQRPRLLERLYPYLSRSPVAQQAMAKQFFGRNLAAWQTPGFAHDTRWRSTAAVQRMFAPSLRAAIGEHDVVATLRASLPAEFAKWDYLAQDQYLEIRGLLAGYLLSSQGDRMLLGHSVEGRFPFLDPNVIDLADRLPSSYKLRGLDEKHVLKQASRGYVPESIRARPKQPYRAPDALSFVGAHAPEWIAEALSERAAVAAGVFDPRAVAQLRAKCVATGGERQFSNTDNMALTGMLSTHLLHQQLIVERPRLASISLRTFIDKLAPVIP